MSNLKNGFKVVRLICVECGLIRHPMAKGGCPRCASVTASTVKVDR